MSTPTPTAQPGWYADPENANSQRYWDGQAWTPHSQPEPLSGASWAPASPPPPPPTPVSYAPPAPPNFPPPPNQQVPWPPPGQQPAGSPPQGSGKSWALSVISWVLSVIAVAIVVILVRVVVSNLHMSNSSSPEDQIRALVKTETDQFNRSEFSYNPNTDCRAAKQWAAKVQDQNRKLRAETGTVSTSVTAIHVTGDTATAQVTVTAETVPDQPISGTSQFVKEDGRWKDCTPPSPDSADNNPDGN